MKRLAAIASLATLLALGAGGSAQGAFWKRCGTPAPGNSFITGQVKAHHVPCKTALGLIRRFPSKTEQQGSSIVQIRSFTCQGRGGRLLKVHCQSGDRRVLWRGARY